MNYARVKALHGAFVACEDAFAESRSDAEQLEKAIAEKLQMDQQEKTEKIAYYTAQRDDASQPATVRRLAGMELEKLEAQVIQPSPEELELLRGLLEEQRQCAQDMRGLQRDFRDALKDLEADLASIRSEVLASSTADLAARWTDGMEQRFSRLAGGGSYG